MNIADYKQKIIDNTTSLVKKAWAMAVSAINALPSGRVGVGAVLLAACTSAPNSLPSAYTTCEEPVVLYPDYMDVTIPPNIAPLNCMVEDSLAEAFVAHYQGGGMEMTVGAAEDGILQLDSVQWRSMLQKAKGGDITVTVYAQRDGAWVQHPAFTLSVAEEDIDPYLSYRLIEPGYELYRQIGLYQRNLTTWDEQPIYENNRTYNEQDNHCVNCHNYRQNSTRDMVFHVRAEHGGTIVVQDGKARKIGIKDSTIITSGVYPSWHPTEDLVAFSTNKTGQVFHLHHQEKVEVVDARSDLLLYDVKKNEVSHIVRSRGTLETFPCWTPDGRRLYYTAAHYQNIPAPLNESGFAASSGSMDADHSSEFLRIFNEQRELAMRQNDTIAAMPDSMLDNAIAMNYQQMRYNLMAVDFDPATRTFGEPQTIIDAATRGRSISVPRVSPDGRYVLYTEADYGQFHIWHRSSDLYVQDLQRDSCYALTEANSPDVDSFHSWSSNGRWIVFSSRRMDGNYTRPFIAYFDKNGRARKAFVLPQQDPEWNLLLLKSYNVPELTRDAVRISPEALRECIYNTEPEPAQVNASRPVDGYTGASKKN